MTELPEPLTPADCDLRGYDFMPLYGHRLFASDFYMLSSAEAFRAGLKLWWSAWQQCPAASLPDDDTALCRLADMGRDLKGWKKIRQETLRGFVKCSDGRLYHPSLSEWAMEAWDRRRKERDRKASFRAAKRGQDAERPRDRDEMSVGQDVGQSGDTERDVPADRRGEDRTGQDIRKKAPLTPSPDGNGGPRQSSISEGRDGPDRPEGWVGQWDGLRSNRTNPRRQAKAAVPPPPPEPTSPLWPTFRARGMSLLDFRTWIEPLEIGEVHDGRATVQAPKRFHADHVRREWGPALEAAVGARVDLVAVGAAA